MSEENADKAEVSADSLSEEQETSESVTDGGQDLFAKGLAGVPAGFVGVGVSTGHPATSAKRPIFQKPDGSIVVHQKVLEEMARENSLSKRLEDASAMMEAESKRREDDRIANAMESLASSMAKMAEAMQKQSEATIEAARYEREKMDELRAKLSPLTSLLESVISSAQQRLAAANTENALGAMYPMPPGGYDPNTQQ